MTNSHLAYYSVACFKEVVVTESVALIEGADFFILAHVFVLTRHKINLLRRCLVRTLNKLLRVLALVTIFGGGSCILSLHLVKLLQTLLLLEVLVEVHEILPETSEHLNLLEKHVVKLAYIRFNVTRWLVHLMQQRHIFLDDVHNIVNVLSMLRNKLLFFFKDC